MDLNEYQMKIKNALLNGQWYKTNIENEVKKGGSITRKPYPKIPKPVFNKEPSSYGDNPHNYDATMQMYLKPPNKKRTPVDKKVITPQEYSSDDGFSSDEDIKDIKGGNFIKSIKRVEKPSLKQDKQEGGDLNALLKKTGRQLKKAVVDEAGKTIGREGVKLGAKTLYNGAKSYLLPAVETAATEALPVAETAAPLLLAAGVRKRKVTSRHELIKKVMKKKNMTLPQASKYIKDNKLKY